jgi:membrane-anchored protein YejM (alkaline phosphatase superfamily)
MNQPTSQRPAERRALFELWLANICLCLVQAQVYRAHAPDGIGLKGLVFLNVALLASFAWTSGLVAGLCWLLSRVGLRGRFLAGLSAVLLTTYQVALFIDARTYDLFRYHFNGWVWTVITTQGGISDNIELGQGFVLMACVIIVGTVVAMYVFQRWRTARLVGRSPPPKPLRYGWIVVALVLVPLLVDKTAYATASFLKDREITAAAQLVPLYQRVTVNKLLHKKLGIEAPRYVRLDHHKQLLLHYPLESPKIAPEGPRPNILILVVESLRSDMLSPEIMPFTWDYSKGGRRFLDHASGGSATRYGTFTLLYGLHGSYFLPALAEHASPVLVDTLLDLGYEFKIYGSAQMTFPELRSTAWVKVQKQVEDGLESPADGSRDAELVRRFSHWVETRPRGRPFFAFAFLDAPHFRYRVVQGRTPFKPFLEATDRTVLSSETAARVSPLLFNRYKNSVYDVDNSLSLMLAALQRSGQMDDTIVVITGDHGEEFFEHGMWGHTGNFTYTEVQVPMVMRGPGVPTGEERAPTSHVDLAPTLLEMLGADPSNRAKWTVGDNMFSPAPQRNRVVAGWEVVGTWTPDAIIVLPLNAYRGMPDVYDYDWKPVQDPDAVLQKSGAALRELTESTRRFMR